MHYEILKIKGKKKKKKNKGKKQNKTKIEKAKNIKVWRTPVKK